VHRVHLRGSAWQPRRACGCHEGALTRLRELMTTVRVAYGDDPLFDAFLDEVACLCLEPAQVTSPDARRLPPAGWDTLRPREREVAEMLAGDCSDKEVAAALAISVNTARSYSTAVLGKLGVHSRRSLHRLVQLLGE